MNKNLNELILAKCREIVWQKNGSPVESLKPIHEREAALMAMEELANFFRWAIGELWWPHQDGKWYPAEDLLNSPGVTEEQLYEEYGRVKG